jgi:triacylglycerol esterase/lipase EstA (alpha/beta hydrolase family)
MRPHSALARILRLNLLVVAACALTWLLWQWPQAPVRAVVGFVLIAMGFSLVLAIEFVALRFVEASAAAPRPAWAELARAWWAETVAAALVFNWRQPFRWRAIPDQSAAAGGRRGVVFIHGFICNRGLWTPWLQEARRLGIPFVAVNLEPVFGSIDRYAGIIDEAVERIARETGLAPVLVCHSMGGLAARAWLRAKSADDRIQRIVTIGSPHHGTWLARFSRVRNGRQMRLDSEWLRNLGPPAAPYRFTCWYSNCDNIVFPTGTAMLDGADNRLVTGAGHVDLAFHPRVMAETLALVAGESGRS